MHCHVSTKCDNYQDMGYVGKPYCRQRGCEYLPEAYHPTFSASLAGNADAATGQGSKIKALLGVSSTDDDIPIYPGYGI